MNTEPYRNSNMDQRPSNASLLANAIIQCVIAGFASGIIVLFILMFSKGFPFDTLAWSLVGLGVAAGFAWFLPKHFRYARNQKAAYISAGGDPTGINLFMFGAMGGKVRPDGIWQWHDPNSDY